MSGEQTPHGDSGATDDEASRTNYTWVLDIAQSFDRAPVLPIHEDVRAAVPEPSLDEVRLPKSFPLFRSQFPILGESYQPLLLGLWFWAVGGLLHKLRVEVGVLCVDTRLATFVAILSGRAKTALKRGLKRILGPDRVSEATSRHPEQMIGAMMRIRDGRNERYEPNYGYMKDDFLVYDEALDVMKKIDDLTLQYWRYFTLGMDPYGENWVTKRTVKEPRLPAFLAEYSPLLLFQPDPFLPRILIDLGPFRRGLPIIVNVPDHEIRETLKRRPKATNPTHQGLEELKGHFGNLEKLLPETSWSGAAADALAEEAQRVLDIASGHSSASVRYYSKTMVFTFQDFIAKFAFVLAVDELTFGKTVEDQSNPSDAAPTPRARAAPSQPIVESNVRLEIRQEHVQWAAEILLYLLKEASFPFFEQCMASAVNAQTTDRRITLLQILMEWGCVSEDTSQKSIMELEEEAVKRLSVSMGTARNLFYATVDDGLVDRRQGRHSSRVWLTAAGLQQFPSSAGVDSQSLTSGNSFEP